MAAPRRLGDLSEPALYGELAAWWPLVSAPDEYAEEAAAYLGLLREACEGPLLEVLELGSGGGNNASHLKRDLQLTLVDRSAAMLEVSRALNPECDHVVGDMRSVRLRRTFDAVFVHDAVSYLTSPVDLRAAIETAFVHCRPGGAALLVPDSVRETYASRTGHGGRDAPDGRALRYLEWIWDPDPADTTYVTDFAFLLRQADGSVHAIYDRHVLGLFDRGVWLRVLQDAGFRPQARRLSFGDGSAVEAFLARSPARA